MKANVGGTDKIMRLLIGLSTLGMGGIFESWWGVVGIIPIATSLLRWCPAYLPFGFSTCESNTD